MVQHLLKTCWPGSVLALGGARVLATYTITNSVLHQSEKVEFELKHQGFFQIFDIFLEISHFQDFLRFFEIFRDFRDFSRFFKIFRDFPRFFEIFQSLEVVAVLLQFVMFWSYL